MMTKDLKDLVQRAQSWPEDAQAELAHIAQEIEAEVTGGLYRATPEELRGVDRGLRDAAQGKFVSEEQVEAVFAKHKGDRVATRPPKRPAT